MAKLGVNIDHVATVREARRTIEPDPLYAAFLAEKAGCHGITAHLREDERHIKKADVYLLKEKVRTKLNLEMAIAPRIVDIACDLKPQACCLVPEKREEVTTEGGLAVFKQEEQVTAAVQRLSALGIEVSLFIDPDEREIDAAARSGAPVIELHTGTYANATAEKREKEFLKLTHAISHARQQGLIVNAGHGLTYFNIAPLAQIETINEFNIGHSIISRAVFTGLEEAVRDMLYLLQ